MNRRIITVAVVLSALWVVSACDKETNVKPLQTVTIHATLEGSDPSTRTAVSEDGKVSWMPGDNIYVYVGSDFQNGGTVPAYPCVFESDLSSPAYSADFTGQMSIDEHETYFAFYPGDDGSASYWGTRYNSLGEMDNPFDGYLIPDQDESFDGEIGAYALLATYSQGSLDNLRFMNVCSGLKFSLSSRGFTEVSLRGNDGEPIAGAFMLDFDYDATPLVNPDEDAAKVVTLSSLSSAYGFFPDEWLYLLIFPQTFEKGITISFKKDGVPAGSIVINDPIEFKRGVWKKAANIDTKVEFSYFDEYGNIIFADEEVKRLCVNNWDTNNDGGISLSEAEAVTDLGTVFKEKKNIETFNELRFFTGLTKISDHAFNKSSIKEIKLPGSITTIERYAFNECSNLSGKLLLPENLTTIGDYAFCRCTSLTGDLDLSNVSTLGVQAFLYSGFNGRLILSEELAIINSGTFSHCAFTGSLVIPDSVTEIARDAFFGSDGFRGTLTLGNGLTKIGTFAFVCGDVYTYYCPFDTIVARGTTPASLWKNAGSAVSNVGPFSETMSGTTSMGSQYNYKAPSTVYVPTGCAEIYETKWSWTSKAQVIERSM